MAHFTTAGKRYREGTAYAEFGDADINVPPPPASATTYEQLAPSELPDVGGNRKFLFWDTGRRVTNKRRVRWTFSHADTWTTWNAVAYYGVPPTGSGGGTIVAFDAHWVGTGSLDPTPVDGPGSTFVNGPGGGQTAWPAAGNDHQVDTQWGAATVRALDHLQRSPSDPQLDFSSLQQLIYGGDNSGVFEENDDGLTAGGGIVGIASTTAQQLSFPQNSGALVLASYVRPVPTDPGRFFFELVELIRESVIKFKDRGDPSPEDLVRLKLIADSLDLVRGERPSADVFDGLVKAARDLSAPELKRTIAATRATLQRGEAALKALEGMQGNIVPKGRKK